jgi:hypothetical protein
MIRISSSLHVVGFRTQRKGASDFSARKKEAMLFGPQHEPIFETAEERASLPDSSVAAGTDRDALIQEYAATLPKLGPQGEPLPPVPEGTCPLCGQELPDDTDEPDDDTEEK